MRGTSTSVGVLGTTASFAAEEQLRGLLERQADELEAVLGEVGRARRALLAEPDGRWRGLTRMLYSIGLTQLVTDLASAGGCLESALRQTRQAIDSLGSRVG
ncbi:MAG: hypothetical protein ACYCZY_02110 [Lacisediminihabitans sp.]